RICPLITGFWRVCGNILDLSLTLGKLDIVGKLLLLYPPHCANVRYRTRWTPFTPEKCSLSWQRCGAASQLTFVLGRPARNGRTCASRARCRSFPDASPG